ncbi:hypothetical protein PV328_011458 [Microctonus aethiopoides]|uniref:Uncharacterized protein n=1 Tax=Microctonus aethiopoides TaxID=144406 RepID=A0AA39C5D3_9HYME|nr:hypothetical protein PV328_011458 [Microctonus aethiopoides]
MSKSAEDEVVKVKQTVISFKDSSLPQVDHSKLIETHVSEGINQKIHKLQKRRDPSNILRDEEESISNLRNAARLAGIILPAGNADDDDYLIPNNPGLLNTEENSDDDDYVVPINPVPLNSEENSDDDDDLVPIYEEPFIVPVRTGPINDSSDDETSDDDLPNDRPSFMESMLEALAANRIEITPEQERIYDEVVGGHRNFP